MTKKLLYIILSLALVTGLVAGCFPRKGEPAPAAAEGVLNLSNIDPLTLDPAVSGDATSHEYILQLFSGLVRLDDDLRPAPDIAADWQISRDGKTYTFNLRRDVRFHDGRKVTAQDVKYSWERACDPATSSRTASTYLGDIIGVREVLAGVRKDIGGVRIIDDYTLEVTIDAPKSYFLSKLTYPTAFVVDRANVESGSGWWRKPNGTGPFRLKQWDKNELLVLEANGLYHGVQAKVESVVFWLWAGVPMNLYEMGKIDVAEVYTDYIDKAADKSGPFHRDLMVVPELSFFYLGFNTTRPPFDDIDIRRAFSHAVDKDKLVSLVSKDTVQRADGILPPGLPGYNGDLVGIEYDVDKAKELIAASKYGDVSRLPPITITTSGWGGMVSRELEAVVYQWQQNLGVEVKVRQLEPERFLYQLKAEKDEMFLMGWIADYPHPQDFLEILFRSGAESNYGEYSNAEVDSLLGKANVEPDIEQSLALYQQAEQILVEDAACLPLWFGKSYILSRSYVKGYQLNPMGFAMLNSVSVEPH
ncbi:MAG: peptide ABC transporter substrate-binding protein [Chloroflexi bacterium]|nr:peptide ABC transporter substrate-binding protein [Chloroflexota bacterium]